MEYQKVKSAAKEITTQGDRLSNLILETMAQISKVVGATLGPCGQQVLIERFEHAMPPMVTKDGVTVFRSLGFRDPSRQVVMELTRDAATRTASEAGDGTTTATILAEAVVRLTMGFIKKNPRFSSQKVVRRLETAFRDVIEPTIRAESLPVDFTSVEGKATLAKVASISANGDRDLAKAVMECFEIVGDAGNVTISETSGPSSYEVEEIDGYPIPMGYEGSCARFASKFINDPGSQMTRMEDPVFVLYHGSLSDVQTAYTLLSKVGDKFQELIQGEQNEYRHHNVVFVATGFSEMVLATFASGWELPNSIKIFPLMIPMSPLPNFQTEFLQDLAAITGANVFDPINKPLDTGSLEDLGPGVTSFEATRWRSAIIGRAASLGEPWETNLLDQIDVVTQQLARPESELDGILLQERLGKLTGGIAKLRVIGASNGELKEKRDRAEDAVCAVRGAIKHGCLPGGGWALIRVIKELGERYPGDIVIDEILRPALLEPVDRLLSNCGMLTDEIRVVLEPVIVAMKTGKRVVYDAMENKHGDPFELGVLDSTPAVLEAIRNSISIASLLGTSGGIVAFPRDRDLELSEAKATQSWLRDVGSDNPADERP